MNKLSLRGVEYYYDDINPEKSEVVVLIHGHPFNHTMWQYQQKALSSFRLILPDLRGYGSTGFSNEKIYIEDHVLDIIYLLDALKIDKVDLIGLSMGGQILVEFYRLFPHRVKSMVLCATTPHGENEESLRYRHQMIREIEETGMLAHTKAHIHNYINIKLHPPGSLVYDHLYRMMSSTDSKGAVAAHKGRAERRDNFGVLKAMTCPVLVIAGAEDGFFKVADVQQVATEIPGSRFEVISDCGHLPNMENPSLFNEYLIGFYRELAF